MKKQIKLLLILPLLLLGCGKESKTMIAATVYLTDFPLNGEESRVRSNIAFIRGDASEIIKNAESVDLYFKSKPPLSAFYVDQYREYVEDGDYTILVQIADLLVDNMHTTYSYKKVMVSSGSETPSNVMIFKKAPKGYQPWNDKY